MFNVEERELEQTQAVPSPAGSAWPCSQGPAQCHPLAGSGQPPVSGQPQADRLHWLCAGDKNRKTLRNGEPPQVVRTSYRWPSTRAGFYLFRDTFWHPSTSEEDLTAVT